jgi:hypothetical protein
MQVQCYAGAKADERPVRFQLDDHAYFVEEVLDQWYGPEDTYFKVLAEDGNVYILCHHPPTDTWSLESFRRGEILGSGPCTRFAHYGNATAKLPAMAAEGGPRI